MLARRLDATDVDDDVGFDDLYLDDRPTGGASDDLAAFAGDISDGGPAVGRGRVTPAMVMSWAGCSATCGRVSPLAGASRATRSAEVISQQFSLPLLRFLFSTRFFVLFVLLTDKK